jgi:membrane protein implicated in regulation of membrane protease activity
MLLLVTALIAFIVGVITGELPLNGWAFLVVALIILLMIIEFHESRKERQ